MINNSSINAILMTNLFLSHADFIFHLNHFVYPALVLLQLPRHVKLFVNCLRILAYKAISEAKLNFAFKFCITSCHLMSLHSVISLSSLWTNQQLLKPKMFPEKK